MAFVTESLNSLYERMCCRAVLVQLGFYFHMKQSLGYSRLVLTRPLLFTMGFMLFFSIVIALFKDIPDVRGDRQVSLYHLHARFDCFPSINMQIDTSSVQLKIALLVCGSFSWHIGDLMCASYYVYD